MIPVRKLIADETAIWTHGNLIAEEIETRISMAACHVELLQIVSMSAGKVAGGMPMVTQIPIENPIAEEIGTGIFMMALQIHIGTRIAEVLGISMAVCHVVRLRHETASAGKDADGILIVMQAPTKNLIAEIEIGIPALDLFHESANAAELSGRITMTTVSMGTRIAEEIDLGIRMAACRAQSLDPASMSAGEVAGEMLEESHGTHRRPGRLVMIACRCIRFKKDVI